MHATLAMLAHRITLGMLSVNMRDKNASYYCHLQLSGLEVHHQTTMSDNLDFDVHYIHSGH